MIVTKEYVKNAIKEILETEVTDEYKALHIKKHFHNIVRYYKIDNKKIHNIINKLRHKLIEAQNVINFIDRNSLKYYDIIPNNHPIIGGSDDEDYYVDDYYADDDDRPHVNQYTSQFNDIWLNIIHNNAFY